MTSGELLTILGACGASSVVTAVVQSVLRRRKDAADVRQVEISGELQISAAAIELVETLRGEVNRLKERVEHLERENQALEAEVAQLREGNTNGET